MTKKSIFIVLSIIFLAFSHLKADEGMWIPLLLKKYNIEDMKKKGFKLKAEDIYSINKASMKDAVMIFGGGCTGELISDQGLLITNHHCGFGAIQSHSSLDHDYLTDGFWAMNKSEELPNERLSVTFLVRMTDVSNEVFVGITDDTPENKRKSVIEQNIIKIKKKAIEGTNYKASVKPFFFGNQYFLFVQEVYTDVRLVGAPPSSIGKFGGDTDNWMWPRHTGDFSLFRIYADKNNKPAEYSESNVPFKPKKHFPISVKGVKKGDFTMVFGYPGRTQEYLTSYAVDMITNKSNPHKIAIRQSIIDIMSTAMEKDKGVRIKYASKYAGVSNAWKKWIGESRGLKRLNAVSKKEKIESELTKWIKSDKIRAKKYGHLLSEYKKLYQELEPLQLADDYFNESIWRMESVRMSNRIALLVRNGAMYKQSEVDALKKYSKRFFKDYEIEVDKKIFRSLIEKYYDYAGKKYRPEFMKFISEMKNLKFSKEITLDLYTELYFRNTFYLNQEKLDKFLNEYSAEKANEIKKAPAYQFYRNFVNMYLTKVNRYSEKIHTQISKLNRVYMKALMEADTAKVFYPDANFTLRVAFGKVDDYYPKDGVKYKHYTTLKGIIEKDNPDIYDYDVPDKLKELYKNRDFGQYEENGEMHVCFTASNHTTGGNSGSPVINGNGELIGVNFDRNWEGTMSDIMYDPDQCRNITLDIRYALFIIDKFAGAKHLIEEMTIIK